MKNTKNSTKIKIPPTRKEISSLAEESLHAMHILQSSLDINILIQLFDNELRKISSHSYLNYKNSIEKINISLGELIEEKLTFDLKVDNNSLGKLVISRNSEFSKWEIDKINDLVSVLIQPINNALIYRQAITNASTDPITELNNRMLFNKIIEQEIEFAQRYKQKLLLMMLDLDNFKKINDSYGHTTGDLLLHNIGKILIKLMRRSDLVFRYGGDEFCIILRNTSLDGASTLADRIRKDISEQNFNCNNIEIKTSISIGLVKLHEDDNSIKFIERADNLLYEAKKLGRNNVIVE